MLDPDGEVVALHAVPPAFMAAIQRAVVQRRDVPGAILLAHELRDLAAVFVHDVMRAHLRDGIVEPAPAARVVALASVDDHHVRHAGRVGGPLVEVGRRPPDAGWKIGRTGGVRRRARGGCLRRSRDALCLRERGEVSDTPRGQLGPAEPRGGRIPVTARIGGVGSEQRRRGADVRDGIMTCRFNGHARQAGSPLERLTPQPHHPKGRGPARKLLGAPHHLPARLDPAYTCEQRRRHMKLGAGGPEDGIKLGARGWGLGIWGDARESRRGTGLHGRFVAAGGEREEYQPRDAGSHGACLTSSTRRAGPVSSDTRYTDGAATPRTHATCPSKSQISVSSRTAGSPGVRWRSAGARLPCSSCAWAGSKRTTRRPVPATVTGSPEPQRCTGFVVYSTR